MRILSQPPQGTRPSRRQIRGGPATTAAGTKRHGSTSTAAAPRSSQPGATGPSGSQRPQRQRASASGTAAGAFVSTSSMVTPLGAAGDATARQEDTMGAVTESFLDDPFAIGPVKPPVNQPQPKPARVPRDVQEPLIPEADDPIADGAASGLRLTPAQKLTFDQLLEIGGERPYAPIGLVEQLHDRIAAGVDGHVARWSERTFWLGKSMLSNVRRCEGYVVAERSTGRRGMLPAATAIGIVSHRAIQLSYTHPGRSIGEYVREAVDGSLNEDGFRAWWENADMVAQSDLIAGAEEKTTAFVDSWPPLSELWVPRFEASLQARVGNLVLSAKPDLTLGRPKSDGRQTMLLVDLKTGSLNETHELEAAFYALVATLRYRVPPWRSCVYSLASGEWTEADVTAETLLDAADAVVDATCRLVEILGDQRAPELTVNPWCRWCQARDRCEAYLAAEGGDIDTGTQ